MSFGGGIPPAGPGGVYNYQGEPWSGDPRISPGLSRAIGWRVREPDGSAAYDKFGAGDEDWVPVGTASVVGGVDSINGLVGVLALATIVPGQNVTQPDASTILISGGGQTRVANLTALAALNASTFPIGNTWAWVVTLGRWFQLQTSALPTGINAVTANSLAGAQWLATNWLNPVWQAQTAWSVNTATGNDENAGTSGAPLLTVSEVARRLAYALVSATTVTVTGNMASSDKPFFTITCKTFNGFTIASVPTVLYTGSITTAVNVSPAPTLTENNITDTAIPTSYTASGLLANGVLFQRTSGAPAQWWAALDKGSKTLRTSQPINAAAFTDSTFANGDAYEASQLSTMSQMYFTETAPFSVLIANWLIPSGVAVADLCLTTLNCFQIGGNNSAVLYINHAFQGSAQINGSAVKRSLSALVGGMVRGSGASILDCFETTTINIDNKVTCQGAGILVQSGFLDIQADLLAYDFAGGVGAAPLGASYWGIILWSSGAFGGSNNSAIAAADRMSYIGHLAGPAWLAGSSTSGTPIFVSGTGSISVATEAAGGGAVNANQNGIFPTT